MSSTRAALAPAQRPGRARLRPVARDDTGAPPGPVLIELDTRTIVYLGLCVVLFVLGVSLELHFSSVGMWHHVFGEPAKLSQSVLLGTPRAIRSDEWVGELSHLLSQAEQGFPVENPALGVSGAPHLMGLPVRGLSALFRPSRYGFFLFGSERAIAYYWLFRVFVFLAAVFLLVKLLTGSFWLALVGSWWAWLSSGTQWWSLVGTHYVMFFGAIVVAVLSLLYATSRWAPCVAGVVVVVCGYEFVVQLYPPWQVTLVYLAVVIVAAYLWTHLDRSRLLRHAGLKVGCLVGVVLALAWLLYRFQAEAAVAVDAALRTAYPGRRVDLGGDFGWRLFSEFFFITLNGATVPPGWENISEASGFLLMAPVVAYRVIANRVRRLPNDVLVVALLVFALACVVYCTVGLPEPLARALLVSRVPAKRLVLALGLANIIAVVAYLASSTYDRRLSKTEAGLVFAGSYAFALVVLSALDRSVDHFFTTPTTLVMAAVVAVAYTLLAMKGTRWCRVAACAVILVWVAPNIAVNPLTRGLSPILDNPLYLAVREMVRQDRGGGRWVVFSPDEVVLSGFLKATGANVLSGVKYAPDIPLMRRLDPTGKDDTIYNRFAYVGFRSSPEGRDGARFDLRQFDFYTIEMDPCGVRALDVHYVMFSYPPTPREVRCMDAVLRGPMPIYRLR